MIIKNIQGLRGVAVLLVILFHLNHQTFFFGFVGVDIFFIISGFVITKSIFKNLNSKNYEVSDILKFYSKRILRIMPALFVMIILSTTFIILFSVLSRETITFINTGLFSLIAISNFYLMNIKTDYFQEDVNPFLHTWSLGVEEQFYLIFPLLIFFTYKFNIKKILPILTFFFL
jgi:peptidoglycan/LPS O-acetylase OafA/YrhL